ncbi:MAG TPA: signal peptidase I [Caulobacteraceae bacterium]|nr:signal peptidase I [Caulobacteraceae bacterium]
MRPAVLAVLGAATLVAFVAMRLFLFNWYSIPSHAMEPTFREGDTAFVAEYAYGWSHALPGQPPSRQPRLGFRPPERGDLVVFRLPRDGRTSYIKRLIGLPGDRVAMRGGALYLNGKAVPTRFVANRTAHDRGIAEPVAWLEETLPDGRRYTVQDHGRGYPADDTGDYVVPPHCYFMLGDNRDNSADSRFDPGLPPQSPMLGGCGWDASHDADLGDIGVGFVPEDDLIGKVVFVARTGREGG